jgi:hypothetical protein
VSGALAALARAPALHFLALGALLAAWNHATTEPERPAGRAPIVISAARVAALRDDYARTVAAPTAADLAALVAREADEEMLYREALLLGLDRADGAVKWRIIEKMHFLYGDAAGEPETAYRRGLALGLARDDIVVRNTLVTKMRMLAKAASRHDAPAGPALERALEAYLQRYPEAYRQTDRLSFTHVFVSADRRGPALEADARALLQHLRSEALTPDAARATRLGDPFVAGAAFGAVSPSGLAKIFGESFGKAVETLPADGWSEPIPSAYGLHLVWVSGREAADLPSLAAVRSRVLRAYRAERKAEYLRRMMDELRAAYAVRVEDADEG